MLGTHLWINATMPGRAHPACAPGPGACSSLPPAVRLFEYRVGPHECGWVQKHLLEAWEFPAAALEFGGDRRCQQGAEGRQGGGKEAGGHAASLSGAQQEAEGEVEADKPAADAGLLDS